METLTPEQRAKMMAETALATPRQAQERNEAYRSRLRSQVSLGLTAAQAAEGWLEGKAQAWTIEHAKIGAGGKKVHRVLAHWEITGAVRILLNAYSLCGSARFTLNGRGRIQILSDGLECTCEKCLASITPRRATA